MHRSRLLAATCVVGLVVGASATTANASGADRTSRTERSPVRFMGDRAPLVGTARTARVRVQAQGRNPANEVKSPDLKSEESAPQGGSAVANGFLRPPYAASTQVTNSAAGVVSRFEGLNHFDSRYSDNGNAYSGEPPDQALCVNGRYVFEAVNSVVQVYTKSGQPLIEGDKAYPDGPAVGLSLNQFYGLPPSIVRPAGPYGPFMFDPSCRYDYDSKRWFVTSANLDQDPTTGEFTGANQVWLAVSKTSNPLDGWNIWSVDTTNNGQNGTPNHNCAQDACFGDYPQIGLDAEGFYLTTNEFEFFGDKFNGAQVYAFSKDDLAAGTAKPTMQMFENVKTKTYQDVAYTLQPVNALPADFASRNNGTMYFGMSGSAYTDGLASSIVLYSLSRTDSLRTDTPNVVLSESAAATQRYATPTFARQKPGPMPLLRCINDGACIGEKFRNQKAPLVLDAGNSSKVYGAWLHNGRVYLTAGTALKGRGAARFDNQTGRWWKIRQRTGVAWFVVRPGSGSSDSTTVRDGYLAVRNANLTYPSIVVGPSGAGAIGATLVGPDIYPSAAVARFAPGKAPRQVQVTGRGRGPNDGFTATAYGGYDPRWGDYGAATVTPNGTMWLASEYIAQRCTFDEWLVDSTCGYTRTFLANWSTYVTGIKPLR